jgi:hypothetical protein
VIGECGTAIGKGFFRTAVRDLSGELGGKLIRLARDGSGPTGDELMEKILPCGISAFGGIESRRLRKGAE